MPLTGLAIAATVLATAGGPAPPMPDIINARPMQNPLWVSLDAVNDGRARVGELLSDNGFQDGLAIEEASPEDCDEYVSGADYFDWVAAYDHADELFVRDRQVLAADVVDTLPGFYAGMPAFLLQLRVRWMSESAFREFGWSQYRLAVAVQGSVRQEDRTLCWRQVKGREWPPQQWSVAGARILYFPLHRPMRSDVLEFVYEEELVVDAGDVVLIPTPREEDTLIGSSFDQIERRIKRELVRLVTPDQFE